MSRSIITVIGLALLVAPAAARAQSRLSFELRPGGAIATQDLADASLGTGFGFEGTIGYRVLPHLSVYGGWDWHRFTSDASFAGNDVDIEETGYAFGLRFQHPIGGSEAIALRIRAGGTYNHVEIEDSDGALIVDSEHGVGWEAGAGLAFRAGGWELSPGVRFRALTRDFTIGNATTSGSLRYVTIEIGIGRRF
jgi:hypothetical protein